MGCFGQRRLKKMKCDPPSGFAIAVDVSTDTMTIRDIAKPGLGKEHPGLIRRSVLKIGT